MTRPPSVKSLGLWLFAWMAVIAIAPAAAREVPESISARTTGSIADSPITVMDMVTVDNGAAPSVDAGVQVRFEAHKKLILEKGLLQAIGSTSSPNIFASVPPRGNPVDWRAFEMQSSKNDAAMVPDKDVIRHGKGLSVTHVSPRAIEIRKRGCY